eukprot:3396117-Pleurochrysis_carterae.AAC.1
MRATIDSHTVAETFAGQRTKVSPAHRLSLDDATSIESSPTVATTACLFTACAVAFVISVTSPIVAQFPLSSAPLLPPLVDQSASPAMPHKSPAPADACNNACVAPSRRAPALTATPPRHRRGCRN